MVGDAVLEAAAEAQPEEAAAHSYVLEGWAVLVHHDLTLGPSFRYHRKDKGVELACQLALPTTFDAG